MINLQLDVQVTGTRTHRSKHGFHYLGSSSGRSATDFGACRGGTRVDSAAPRSAFLQRQKGHLLRLCCSRPTSRDQHCSWLPARPANLATHCAMSARISLVTAQHKLLCSCSRAFPSLAATVPARMGPMEVYPASAETPSRAAPLIATSRGCHASHRRRTSRAVSCAHRSTCRPTTVATGRSPSATARRSARSASTGTSCCRAPPGNLLCSFSVVMTSTSLYC